jgi:hypothetical protein
MPRVERAYLICVGSTSPSMSLVARGSPSIELAKLPPTKS